jgi:hypothetical protein
MREQLGDGKSDVFRDLAQKSRCNIATGMKRNGGRATRTVTKLLVGTALANLDKAELSQDGYNLRGL